MEVSVVAPLFGGVLIGLAAAMLLWTHGRVAGVSGIAAALVAPHEHGAGRWRVAFLSGLVAGGLVLRWLAPSQLVVLIDRSVPLLLLAGVLVGLGTYLAGGCTSGHGVCGLGRLSRRSLVAVLVFIGVGVLTATVARWLIDGGS